MDRTQIKETIQALEDSFKGTVTVHDYTGRINPLLGREYALHSDPFCTVARTPEQAKGHRCVADDLRWVQARLGRSRERFFKACHMNVCEAVCPVLVGNELCGTLFFGPFRPDNDFPEESIIYTTRLSRISRQEKAAIQKLPVVPFQKAGNIMVLAATVTLQIGLLISEQSAIPHEGLDRSQLIDMFLRQRMEQNIGLQDLADYLNLSASRVTQLLRKLKGRSFPELLNEVRITRAKRYLATSCFTIGRIAEIVGFTDQAYMNRVFRKMENMTPGQYRKKHFEERLP